MVEANSFEGWGHGLPGDLEQYTIEFFDLNATE